MDDNISPDSQVAKELAALGQKIRAQRKGLGINASALAEAAGISRVTLHRIEKGAPSVAISAYLNAAAALGLHFILAPTETAAQQEQGYAGWIPASIRLADYPQLARLAWQVQGSDRLAPKEAWDIYERNGRHLDTGALTQPERELIDALRTAFGNGGDRV